MLAHHNLSNRLFNMQLTFPERVHDTFLCRNVNETQFWIQSKYYAKIHVTNFTLHFDVYFFLVDYTHSIEPKKKFAWLAAKAWSIEIFTNISKLN